MRGWLWLYSLNERKSRIDKQIAFLSDLPKVQPFEPLAPQRSTVPRKKWEEWWREHDRIDGEADLFRDDEINLMKKVAKGALRPLCDAEVAFVDRFGSRSQDDAYVTRGYRRRRTHVGDPRGFLSTGTPPSKSTKAASDPQPSSAVS